MIHPQKVKSMRSVVRIPASRIAVWCIPGGAMLGLIGFLLALGTVVALPRACHGCTALIAGRSTTADGSILFAKTEDDTEDDVDFLWHIPRRQHRPHAMVPLRLGGAVPQAAETYAYFWDQVPGADYSNFVVNEWGLAIGSNACPSREDSPEEVAARGDLVDGGIGFELRMILAERARTAREAVELAARLLDEYGYAASGRCLHIVGPQEAWQLQMVCGKQYVARRVKDNEVAIIANTYSIREVDTADARNFICSPRLVDYAIERGWYDPAGGKPFDFAAAYASPTARTNPRNTDRQWDLARLLDRTMRLSWREAREGRMPVAVEPDRKLTVKDIMAIFRDHFEGTPLDSTQNHALCPHRAPVRSICWATTHRATIVQQRKWLPPQVGTVIWRALEAPCTSGFVPWYLGVTRIPPAFQMAAVRADTTTRSRVDFHFDMPRGSVQGSAEPSGELFKRLGDLIDADYAHRSGTARQTWAAFEQQELALQPVIEKTALDLYKRDWGLAREYLTLYQNALATRSLELAHGLLVELGGESPPVPQAP
jgi:dipeptidase